MSKHFLIREKFIKKVKISEKVLKEWETAKIIKPAGYTEDNIPLYTSQEMNQVTKIRKFLDIGYTIEDIQKILKKVGLPNDNNSEPGKASEIQKHLTIGGLADRVGVSARTIKHWEDKGIIEPDMRSEGGFRLYSAVFIYLCKLIKDLQLFGYTLEQIKTSSDYFREFLAIRDNIETYPGEETGDRLDAMLRAIMELTEKMNLFKEGIARWEELINKKKKEINNLKKKNQKRGKPGNGELEKSEKKGGVHE